MVRRAPAIARVGAPTRQPGPDRISPPRNLRLITDRALIVSQANALRYGGTERRYSPMPFFLQVVLLVLAIVVLLLAVYFLVRRRL
jgi:cobalamin biosynthesis Mg chelatase CobN